MAGQLLEGLDADTVEALLSDTSQRSLARHAWLFFEGDRSDDTYLIDSGLMKLTKTAANGSQALLSIRGRGAIIGELSAMDELPRLVSAVAATDSKVTCIRRKRLMALMREHPDLMLAVLSNLSRQLRSVASQVLALTAGDATALVSLRLLELVSDPAFQSQRSTRDRTTVIHMPLSQEELATWAGVSLRSATAVLGRLRDDGVISTSRLQLEVHDVEALEARSAERSTRITSDQRR